MSNQPENEEPEDKEEWEQLLDDMADLDINSPYPYLEPEPDVEGGDEEVGEEDAPE